MNSEFIKADESIETPRSVSKIAGNTYLIATEFQIRDNCQFDRQSKTLSNYLPKEKYRKRLKFTKSIEGGRKKSQSNSKLKMMGADMKEGVYSRWV